MRAKSKSMKTIITISGEHTPKEQVLIRTKRLMAAALAAVLMCAMDAAARSSSRASHSQSTEKSVYVHSYTKKDRTQVSAHYRRPPGTATPDTAPRELRSSSAPASPVSYERDHVASGYTLDPTVARDSHGKIKRSSAAKNAFKRFNPCPSTGKPTGGCPGYVIDHVKPLECGGPDDRSNMQWQTIEEGKAKDKTERYCR
jgi:hypothetical protein